jgi:hypothetical protein
MKFQDLFLPKIARSNPQTRLRAVKSESNPALLKKVVENDADQKVREAARIRLKELQR